MVDLTKLRIDLIDKDRDIRIQALKQLGKQKDKDSLKDIFQLLEREKWHYVRSKAWKAVKNISPEIYQKEREKRGLTFKQLFFKNYISIPYWIGILLVNTIFFIPRFILDAFYHTYFLPTGTLLLVSGFFLILVRRLGKKQSEPVILTKAIVDYFARKRIK